jgi:hypothetical protein
LVKSSGVSIAGQLGDIIGLMGGILNLVGNIMANEPGFVPDLDQVEEAAQEHVTTLCNNMNQQIYNFNNALFGGDAVFDMAGMLAQYDSIDTDGFEMPVNAIAQVFGAADFIDAESQNEFETALNNGFQQVVCVALAVVAPEPRKILLANDLPRSKPWSCPSSRIWVITSGYRCVCGMALHLMKGWRRY